MKNALARQLPIRNYGVPDNWWGIRSDSGLQQLAARALWPENDPDVQLNRVFQVLCRAELLTPGLTILGDRSQAEIREY